MVRKRWIIAILPAACMAILSLVFMSVQAAEMPDGEQETEEPAEGDFSYVEHTDTQRTQETGCQITVATECPKGFGLNTYVILSDMNGQMYRVSLSDENGYADRIFVKPGEYTVVETKVYDDNTGRYPFEQSSGEGTISLENGEAADLRFRLSDYDRIAKVISATDADGGETETISENRYLTAFDGITMDGIGDLYYTVEPKGSGIGSLTITGNAKGTYDLHIDILSSGGRGEAKFTVSMDGGNSIAYTDTIPEDGVFPIGDGIELRFANSIRFEKGREYFSDVKSNEESVNMIPVYVMCASVIIVLCAAYGYLLSRKERMEDYDLHKWKDLQEDNVYR